MIEHTINSSVLESPYTSGDNDVNTGASKSKRFETTKTHLVKEKRLELSSAINLIRREKYKT